MVRTQFIIVRHGQTQWNHRGVRQGHLDSDLTERGIAQANALASRLVREHFTRLYSSDLGRALRTAQIIAASTGHEIVTDARLRERNLGIFQVGEGIFIGVNLVKIFGTRVYEQHYTAQQRSAATFLYKESKIFHV